jgi:3-deoxy-D-arabino-heptulosonate 7-phosphate (DAHP) synthase class II
LDGSVLDTDQVENLIKFCPTKEEMEMLRNFPGDKATLGKSEQFFLEMMRVPRMEAKLRVFSFKILFASQVMSGLGCRMQFLNSKLWEVYCLQALLLLSDELARFCNRSKICELIWIL